jgi:hypothetical protein
MLNEIILACFTTGLADEKVRGGDSSRFQYWFVGADAAKATKDRDDLRDVVTNADVARGRARARALENMMVKVVMEDEFQPRIWN